MRPEFVHLRLHTEYSLIDGMVRVKPLMDAVVGMDMPAVAITDQSNLCALVKFQQQALLNGVKPIFGCDIWIDSTGEGGNESEPYSLTLLTMNLEGYRNLTEIISQSYLEGQHAGKPLVKLEWLNHKSAGLIGLSGGFSGGIGRALAKGKVQRALDQLRCWMQMFEGRFYLEVSRTGRADEEDYLHAVVDLANQAACPIVATNDVRFIRAEEFDAHEVRVCIHAGHTLEDPTRPRQYSSQQYLRSPTEMAALFSDLPEAIQNTVEIAKRCNVMVKLGENYLPNYPVPEGMTVNSFFVDVSRKGLERRLALTLDEQASSSDLQREIYDDRLKTELDIIIQMGFPGYFLIVMDFIQWAKENDVPVGPGRGSGAGSLVAYALGITDLDPIAYDLLFERFLNPERVSMPDFDVDFCMDGRDRVIDYVSRQYGRAAVSQIITFGTMAAKAVVRDVGRVQGKSYGFVDRIAKLIPFELGMTLEKALAQEQQLKELYDNDEEARDLLDMALRLEGITRNVGKHAGGVVIAPSKLTDFTPLYCDETGGNLVTQFDKDDVERVGLVKFDFLGLRTLTIIDWAVKAINASRKPQSENVIVDISRIDLADAKTFTLLQNAGTTAVFQLESRGMKDLIKRLKPTRFEDIVALVALFRPGPLQSGMVDDFINRKHGKATVEYPHPDLKPILENTYGVILYQEQVMQIAQVLAGYTLGGADMLRRAMGKKKPEEMAKQREIFTQGASSRGIDEAIATHIFDLMEKFAGYGFNKSHSAAYALLSYQTAWLKTHYPAAFMAAVLSSDMDNTDKVVTLIDECRRMNWAIVSPDVNTSEFRFSVDEHEQIVYGLGAIKGLGEGPIESIVAAREEGGAFRDLFEFCRRIELRKVNRRALEALIRAGALDKLGPSRARMMVSLNEAIKLAEQDLANKHAGMSDLFGDLSEKAADCVEFVEARDWSDEERLRGEKEVLGLYLTGHPIDQYRDELKAFVGGSIADLKPTGRDKLTVIAGLVVATRTMKNKRGDTMAFVTVDDRSARLEVSIFAETFHQCRDVIVKDSVLIVEGEVSHDDFSGNLKMVARKVMSLAMARESYLKFITIDLAYERAPSDFVENLRSLLAPYREDGHCAIIVDYQNVEARACFKLSDNWKIIPKAGLVSGLEGLCGEGRIKLGFGQRHVGL